MKKLHKSPVLACLLLGMTIMTGCGQKGPLELPESAPANQGNDNQQNQDAKSV